MNSIRTYFIFVLVLSVLGGTGLSLVAKLAADRLEDTQSVVIQATAAETSFAAIKIQLDVLITVSDLVFGSDVSYLAGPQRVQITALEDSLETFRVNDQKQFDYAEMQSIVDELSGMRLLLSKKVNRACKRPSVLSNKKIAPCVINNATVVMPTITAYGDKK